MQKRGFTLVELLIVIVVIGILAAISIVSYNGIQQRTLETARTAEAVTWEKVVRAYIGSKGQLPPTLQSVTDHEVFYCLGTGFPTGAGGQARCRDINSTSTGYLESDNTTLMNEFAAVATIPSGEKRAENGTVGPYLRWNPFGPFVEITQVYDEWTDTCPDGLEEQYKGGGRLWCQIQIVP